MRRWAVEEVREKKWINRRNEGRASRESNRLGNSGSEERSRRGNKMSSVDR